MGLSTKLVSIDDHGLDSCQNSLQELPKPPPIRKQPPSKPEPLNCPRCGSINTKFCYYNNYNKSQPRHYCKGCKRHWTAGGTLRNIPVGGGRKNKRTRPTDHSVDHITGRKYVTLEVNDRRCPLITTTITTPTTSNVSSYTIRGNSIIDEGKKEYDIFYETLNIASSSLPLDHTHFSFSSIGPVPCSVPDYVQSSNAYEYMGKFDGTMEESTITTVMPITSSLSQSWQVQETSNLVENMPSTYWNWNEIDTLSAADLNIPWDDLEIKP